MRLIYLFSILVLLSGCGVKVPSTASKAEKRLVRNVRQNNAIIAAYPEIGKRHKEKVDTIINIPPIEKRLELKVLETSDIRTVLLKYIKDSLIIQKITEEIITTADIHYKDSTDTYTLTVDVVNGNLIVDMYVFPKEIPVEVEVEKIVLQTKKFYEFIEFWITVFILGGIVIKLRHDIRTTRSINSS